MQETETNRCSFGVEGLDAITGGGLPRNRLYLLQGDPGVGKTTLALLFLLDGLQRGEKSFYITLSETKEELQEVARSHNWSLDNLEVLELSTIEKHLRTLAPDTLFHPSEIELNRTTDYLTREIDRVKPSRVR
jgi:circadian clock protein KaiC